MLLVKYPHIWCLYQFPQVGKQQHQLPILRIVVKWHNRNAILRLNGIRYAAVVHNHHMLGIAVDISQVFDVEALFECTMLAVETVADEFVVGVQVVQYGIGIQAARSCKDDDLGYL